MPLGRASIPYHIMCIARRHAHLFRPALLSGRWWRRALREGETAAYELTERVARPTWLAVVCWQVCGEVCRTEQQYRLPYV